MYIGASNMQTMDVKFKQWHCFAVATNYENDRKAIQLVENETHEPIATATVNIEEIPIADDQVIVKDYSENEGMVDALVAAGIIHQEPETIYEGGYNGGVKFPVHQLTEAAKWMWNEGEEDD